MGQKWWKWATQRPLEKWQQGSVASQFDHVWPTPFKIAVPLLWNCYGTTRSRILRTKYRSRTVFSPGQRKKHQMALVRCKFVPPPFLSEMAPPSERGSGGPTSLPWELRGETSREASWLDLGQGANLAFWFKFIFLFHLYIYIHIIYIYINKYVCINMYVYINMYVCIYIYICLSVLKALRTLQEMAGFCWIILEPFLNTQIVLYLNSQRTGSPNTFQIVSMSELKCKIDGPGVSHTHLHLRAHPN